MHPGPADETQECPESQEEKCQSIGLQVFHDWARTRKLPRELTDLH